MITIYGYVPAFGVPDISPYVTKVINYMTFTGLEFQHKSQDLATLDQDSPTGKLPYIIDSDGTKVPDSNTIIAYFKNKYGDKLDADLSKAEAANNLAWNRRTSQVVQDFFRADIDALSDYLGDKRYFTGDQLRSLDASVYSTVKHIALQPHPWPGTGYVQTKPNLMAYIERLHAEFGI